MIDCSSYDEWNIWGMHGQTKWIASRCHIQSSLGKHGTTWPNQKKEKPGFQDESLEMSFKYIV